MGNDFYNMGSLATDFTEFYNMGPMATDFRELYNMGPLATNFGSDEQAILGMRQSTEFYNMASVAALFDHSNDT